MMDASRWKLIERLYDEVREMSDEDRTVYLNGHEKTDAELIGQVNDLFAHMDEAAGFFEGFRDDIFPDKDEKPAPAVQDPLLGRLVAQYQIEAKLGGGGMGVVYKALDTKLNRAVALKILNTALNSDDEARERFITEARAASALSHPNVATVFAIEDILDNRLAISMMYCDGASLKDLLKKELPAIEDAVRIAIDIAKGLQAAHQKGIIHRDVKPGNIMLGEDKSVRIVDFGLARVDGQARITRTGSTMGTVAYMSPEQAKGGEATFQSDIWAFGVVLFEMLTGEVPFYGEHLHAMLYSVINEPPVPVAGLRPGIPSQLEHVVSKTITKDLGHRYKNFQTIIDDLKLVQAGKILLESERQLPVVENLSGEVSANEYTANENTANENTANETPANAGYAGEGAALTQVAKDTVKILVVDDEPDIELLLRQQYFRKIRAGEWTLIFAENGSDALEKVAAHPDIKLVLTDIQMPEMDGLTLLTKLGALNRLFRTVVVSAYGDMHNIRRAMNKGAFDFLTKPIQFNDLERTIYKTIDHLKELELARSSQLRLQSLENELGVARKIQQRVLPKRLPESDELAVYAYMEPAPEVNGDFYDFFYQDDEHLGFFIGDVSGKGFSASLFMAMCRTLLKADAQRGISPAACMEALNKFLYPEQSDGVFITVFYGLLNVKTGLLTYCNAGHNPPYILRENGTVETLPWEGGIGIGVKKNFSYENETAQLGEQDGLFLYTDGLLKSVNPDRMLFSEQQLRTVLEAQTGASPSQLIRHVVRDLANFCMGAYQTDDNTLMSIKRTM